MIERISPLRFFAIAVAIFTLSSFDARAELLTGEDAGAKNAAPEWTNLKQYLGVKPEDEAEDGSWESSWSGPDASQPEVKPEASEVAATEDPAAEETAAVPAIETPVLPAAANAGDDGAAADDILMSLIDPDSWQDATLAASDMKDPDAIQKLALSALPSLTADGSQIKLDPIIAPRKMIAKAPVPAPAPVKAAVAAATAAKGTASATGTGTGTGTGAATGTATAAAELPVGAASQTKVAEAPVVKKIENGVEICQPAEDTMKSRYELAMALDRKTLEALRTAVRDLKLEKELDFLPLEDKGQTSVEPVVPAVEPST